MTATVTVIIPNYNGMKFLEPCFEALKAQTYRNFKILVVDNGSSDGSKEWLKAQGVDTIFLEENTGFSGAVNIGIKAADTPYVILLNNDTKADEYYVAEMVKAISKSGRNLFPVVDVRNELIGLVILNDIRNIMFRQELYHKYRVENFMVTPKACIITTDSMEDVMDKFDKTGSWNLPVVDEDNKYIGFVSKSRILSTYRQVMVDFSAE